jgi:hypothetical protein
MSNYSQTFADGTRQARTELYDGTAEIVEYSSNGTVTSTTLVVSDAVPQEETPSAQVIAAQAISDEISSRVDEALTIGELKLAITEGLNAALAQLQG